MKQLIDIPKFKPLPIEAPIIDVIKNFINYENAVYLIKSINTNKFINE